MRCPGCRRPLLFETIASGNTAGGTSWSDGKVVYSMLPEKPWLRFSPSDDALFWSDECRQLGVFDKAIHPEWADLEFAVPPSAAHYFKAIQEKMGQVPQREFYLRQRYWWAGNDRRRQAHNPPAMESVHGQNLHALRKHFGGSTAPEALVFRAEILRELSYFEASIDLLSDVATDDNLGPLADLIYEQAERRNPLVFSIPRFDAGNSPPNGSRAKRRAPEPETPRNDPGIPRPPLERKRYHEQTENVASARTLAEKPGLGEIDRAVIRGFLKPDAKVLDAGCGASRVALGLWEIGFRNVEACDFSPAQVAAARDLLAKRGVGIAVNEWDFSSLPVPDACYDAVICLGNTLNELFSQAEREAVVKELARVVRQGGHFIFSLQCGVRQTELDHILSSPRLVPGQGWNGGAVSRDVSFGQLTPPEIESFGFRCYHIATRI